MAARKQAGTGSVTPLMRQYYRIKERHADAVLLFRMGDFYETFEDDAKKVHEVLGITLTKRSNGQAADVPLAGFPHHALDTYLPRLVGAGLRVAICEQLEDPKHAKTLVRRDVVEIVTPGVSLHDRLLDPRRSNYVAAVHVDAAGTRAGVAYLDASTGEFAVTEVAPSRVEGVLQTVQPAEIIRMKGVDRPKGAADAVLTRLEDWVFTREYAEETLLRHFRTHSLKGFGLEDLSVGIVAAGAVLHYVSETQQGRIPHVRSLTRLAPDGYMALDPQTKRNLELVASMQGGSAEGSLVSILDRTLTPMGARMLRRRLIRPLTDVGEIHRRLDAVDALYASRRLREALRSMLEPVGDVERVAARAATGRAGPRDLDQLRTTLGLVPGIRELLAEENCAPLRDLGLLLDPCTDLARELRAGLVDEPPSAVRDGGVIRAGYSAELDEIRTLARSGKDFIARLQQDEIRRTGIPSLKVGYNKVFGYYLEITNTHRDRIPDDYIRKQTLVNAERYVTPALKEYEEKILTAEERIASLEAELFAGLRERVARALPVLQQNAHCLAELDTHSALAEVAVRNRYVRPYVHEGRDIEIENGRHPVVERALPPGEPFIPNSVRLDPESEQILLITGPNMAGKSVALRQVGLIVLLAQVGSFVPAEKARIGVVDRIFTRVGASDNLAAGESTFLVEMNETASILHNATPRSLILLDEVGRGTSTFDGLSIAWALVEYLHERPDVAARTLFATHYHELNELADRYARIRNFRVQVQEHGDKVVFLRRLVPGGADHSYGIEVARMAGLPGELIGRAREVLRHLESQQLAEAVGESGNDPGGSARTSGLPEAAPAGTFQMSLFGAAEPDPLTEAVREKLRTADPDRMTPIEALLLVSSLRRLADEHGKSGGRSG
jgi:DNA mismatch repair protein MutS